jgi:hypothetical protein
MVRIMVLKGIEILKTGLIDLLVYYEVPVGQRDEVKKKFDHFLFVGVSG